MRLVTLLFAAACVSGCATESRGHAWSKPGSTVDDYTRQKATCDMSVSALPPADLWTTLARNQRHFNNCMVAAGWSPAD